MKKVSLKGVDMKPETEKAKKVYRSVMFPQILPTPQTEGRAAADDCYLY